MSIEKITSKILGDAETERDIMLADARAQSDAVLAEAEKHAAMLLADAEQRGEIEKQKIITRRKSVADIDCRKVLLAKKQEMIEACFARAIDEITAMPEAAYIDLLVNLGKASGTKKGDHKCLAQNNQLLFSVFSVISNHLSIVSQHNCFNGSCMNTAVPSWMPR